MKKYYEANKEQCDLNFAQSNRNAKVKLNEKFSKADERIARDSFNGKCYVCGSIKSLAIDHHVPLTLANAVLLYRSCNSKKGKKLPQQFYMLERLVGLALIFKRDDKCQEKKT